MLSSRFIASLIRKMSVAMLLTAALAVLSSCQFEPLYGNHSVSGGSSGQLSSVTVGDVDTRVAQQVRNHLLFMLNGGNAPVETKYKAVLRVQAVKKTLANIQAVEDRTVGSVEVIVSYDLLEIASDRKSVV